MVPDGDSGRFQDAQVSSSELTTRDQICTGRLTQLRDCRSPTLIRDTLESLLEGLRRKGGESSCCASQSNELINLCNPEWTIRIKQSGYDECHCRKATF